MVRLGIPPNRGAIGRGSRSIFIDISFGDSDEEGAR